VRDADGFDEFYRDTRQRVLEYVYMASARNLAEAQDAVAEAYARAWQRWHTVRACADPEAWVRVVAWRVIASVWRKQRSRATAHRRYGPPGTTPAISEDSVALVAALRQLPPEQRVAMVLYYIVELPVAQIAVETGVAVGTVKSRLSRGRQALSTLLSPAGWENHHV
jgi:RNA polymerase sigma-70 factor (ECF subfamily)